MEKNFMIFGVSKPKALFKKVLKKAFDMALGEIEDSIKVFGPEENNTFFSNEIISMFGGIEKLYEHIILLKNISESERVYKVSDYSYLLLDRMLNNFCAIYNDIITIENETDGYKIVHRGKVVKELDIDYFSDIYFYDTNFDICIEDYNQLDHTLKNQLGFSFEIFGVVNRMMPHPDELQPWEVDIDDISFWKNKKTGNTI